MNEMSGRVGSAGFKPVNAWVASAPVPGQKSLSGDDQFDGPK